MPAIVSFASRPDFAKMLRDVARRPPRLVDGEFHFNTPALSAWPILFIARAFTAFTSLAMIVPPTPISELMPHDVFAAVSEFRMLRK